MVPLHACQSDSCKTMASQQAGRQADELEQKGQEGKSAARTHGRGATSGPGSVLGPGCNPCHALARGPAGAFLNPDLRTHRAASPLESISHRTRRCRRHRVASAHQPPSTAVQQASPTATERSPPWDLLAPARPPADPERSQRGRVDARRAALSHGYARRRVHDVGLPVFPVRDHPAGECLACPFGVAQLEQCRQSKVLRG
jgi:hypothetical protein